MVLLEPFYLSSVCDSLRGHWLTLILAPNICQERYSFGFIISRQVREDCAMGRRGDNTEWLY